MSSVTQSGYIDLGTLVQIAHGFYDDLKQLSSEIADVQRMQYLCSHFKPALSDKIHSHPVTKKGKSWIVSFQLKWLIQFPWLSYSGVLSGGICRYCILFPEQPQRGGCKGAKPGVLVLTAYQQPYTKALGKDGILIRHELTAMQQSRLFFSNRISQILKLE